MAAILEIEAESFIRPWKHRALTDELAYPEAVQYVAQTDPGAQIPATVIGYIFVRFLADEMHIMKIAVETPWRNRGAATGLLGAAHIEARRRGTRAILLEVRPSNAAAIRFYQKTGFQTIGRRPNYYPPTGEDALVMSQSLKEEP